MGAGIGKSDNNVKTEQSDKSTSMLAATPGLFRSKTDQDVPNERRKSGGLKEQDIPNERRKSGGLKDQDVPKERKKSGGLKVKKKLSNVFDDSDIFEGK